MDWLERWAVRLVLMAGLGIVIVGLVVDFKFVSGLVFGMIMLAMLGCVAFFRG